MAKPLHRIAITVAAAYFLVVALMVFWPTPVDRPAAGQLHGAIAWLHGHGMPAIIDYEQIEFSANIALFIPMGFMAAAWLKNAWIGVLLGGLASCLIELIQLLFLADRFASGLDILANSVGAVTGAASYFLSTNVIFKVAHTSR